MRLFEYFACKKSVVAADLSAVREIINNNKNGILYTPDNPGSLASAVLKLYKNRRLYNKIAVNGYKTSSKFKWPVLAAEIVKESLK